MICSCLRDYQKGSMNAAFGGLDMRIFGVKARSFCVPTRVARLTRMTLRLRFHNRYLGTPPKISKQTT